MPRFCGRFSSLTKRVTLRQFNLESVPPRPQIYTFEELSKRMTDAPENTDGEAVEDLYAQLEDQCSGPQLEALIRNIQSRSEPARREINLSGPKSDKVRNVRRAVDHRFVEINDVRNVLFDGEEHGQQHVFMFKPRDDAAAAELSDFEAIKLRLMESHGVQATELPRYEYAEETLNLVDLRVVDETNGCWIAKWYGHETQDKTDDRQEERMPDGRLRETRIVSRREIKTVMLVRWRPPDLLEIRIDRRGSRGAKDIKLRLGAVWDALKPAVSPASMVSWSMFAVAEKLIEEFAAADDAGKCDDLCFSLGSITLHDQLDGKMTIDPKDSAEPVNSEPNRIGLLKSALVGAHEHLA